MNHINEDHLNWLLSESTHRLKQKYITGIKEHGGDQHPLPEYSTQELLEEIINECIDNLVYALTLYRKIK